MSQMQRLQHPSLRFNPWPDTQWTATDKPVLIVDGAAHRIKALSRTVSGDAAYVVGVGDRELAKLAPLLDVRFLHFYELRAADLSPLSAIRNLAHLKIHWNTKLRELHAIGQLQNLETVALVDLPKVKDLSPLTALSELAALEYSGGIWNRQHAVSLDPIAALPKLEELALTNLRVESRGLRPLAQCRCLKTLVVSNQFETEDYAYLSVALPQVQCGSFAPWVRVEHPNGADTMITGRKKPFLNSKTEASRIASYEEAFRRLQAQFASSLPSGLSSDTG
jgi:hypothetical protein